MGQGKKEIIKACLRKRSNDKKAKLKNWISDDKNRKYGRKLTVYEDGALKTWGKI